MNSISNDINKIINDEIININKKIKGSSILEILKSKIIEKINQIYDDIGSNNDLEASKEYNYEDENKSISAKINYYETPKILLNKSNGSPPIPPDSIDLNPSRPN